MRVYMVNISQFLSSNFTSSNYSQLTHFISFLDWQLYFLKQLRRAVVPPQQLLHFIRQ